MNKLIPAINKNLNEISTLLLQLSPEDYSNPCQELSDASIGEHVRHIIEMFACLQKQYDSGIINYDKRERNVCIQTDPAFAILAIEEIQTKLYKENKKLELKQTIDDESFCIESNYLRELLYNLEHCIHHQALIKVAVLKCEHITIDENFGVARSTIAYRNQCAQ